MPPRKDGFKPFPFKPKQPTSVPTPPAVLQLLHHGDGVESFIPICAKLPKELNKMYQLLQGLDSDSQDLMKELRYIQTETLEMAKRSFWEAQDPQDLDELIHPSIREFIQEKRQRVETKLGEKVSLPTQAYDLIDACINQLDREVARLESDIRTTHGELPTLGVPPPVAPVDKSKAGAEAAATPVTSEAEAEATPIALEAVQPMMATGTPIDPNEPVYCFCRRVSAGSMVGCDNEDCEFEWFHYPCVGLTEQPEGEWYCDTCRIQMGLKPLMAPLEPLVLPVSATPGADGGGAVGGAQKAADTATSAADRKAGVAEEGGVEEAKGEQRASGET